MDRWLIAWICWILCFFAIEIPAMLNRTPGDTLSEQVWRFIAINKPANGWVKLRRFLFLSFLAWLTTHLLFGWV